MQQDRIFLSTLYFVICIKLSYDIYGIYFYLKKLYFQDIGTVKIRPTCFCLIVNNLWSNDTIFT